MKKGNLAGICLFLMKGDNHGGAQDLSLKNCPYEMTGEVAIMDANGKNDSSEEGRTYLCDDAENPIKIPSATEPMRGSISSLAEGRSRMRGSFPVLAGILASRKSRRESFDKMPSKTD